MDRGHNALNELNDLNERFYAMYGRLYENSELLTREQKDCMGKKLLELYKNELDLLELRQSVDRAREIYELRQKRSYLIPRTWRFLLIFKRKYNFAAELLNRQVYEEVQNVYTLQELAIEKLHRQLMDEEADADSKVEGEQVAEPQDPAESAEQGEKAPAGSKAEGEQAAEPQDSAESEEQGEKVLAESKAEGEQAVEPQDPEGDA